MDNLNDSEAILNFQSLVTTLYMLRNYDTGGNLKRKDTNPTPLA